MTGGGVTAASGGVACGARGKPEFVSASPVWDRFIPDALRKNDVDGGRLGQARSSVCQEFASSQRRVNEKFLLVRRSTTSSGRPPPRTRGQRSASRPRRSRRSSSPIAWATRAATTRCRWFDASSARGGAERSARRERRNGAERAAREAERNGARSARGGAERSARRAAPPRASGGNAHTHMPKHVFWMMTERDETVRGEAGWNAPARRATLLNLSLSRPRAHADPTHRPLTASSIFDPPTPPPSVHTSARISFTVP